MKTMNHRRAIRLVMRLVRNAQRFSKKWNEPQSQVTSNGIKFARRIHSDVSRFYAHQ